jgi:SAM-dependent methyltransferase
MAIPDWQLPPGVDRGLWDYLHSDEMVRGYDEQMAASPLAAADITFCERAFPVPGRLLDLGCGTGRLCLHFARKGYDCVGVDLSEEMLARARANADDLPVQFLKANLVDLREGEAPAEPWPVLSLNPNLGFLRVGVAPPAPCPPPDPPGHRPGRSPALPDASFDYAACLFSTLGMVRGRENRAKVLANAYRLV